MNPDNAKKLERRVVAAALAALAKQGFVAPIDILVGIDWLAPAQVEHWRRGRVSYLERVATANLKKLGTALRMFRRWARSNGLSPSETVYVTWTPDRRRLRFSASGEEDIERAYSTHWVSPQLSAAGWARRAQRREHRQSEADDGAQLADA